MISPQDLYYAYKQENNRGKYCQIYMPKCTRIKFQSQENFHILGKMCKI